MSDNVVARLRKQIGGPRDGSLLRFSIGNALVAEDKLSEAIVEFRETLNYDPNYSAAWKALGRALNDAGDTDAAIEAYTRGIEVASARGDQQAAKEMQVFLKRLLKSKPNPV
jgi:predicted Zn-dependent protease